MMISSTPLGIPASDSFEEFTERKLQTPVFEFFVHVIVRELEKCYGHLRIISSLL